MKTAEFSTAYALRLEKFWLVKSTGIRKIQGIEPELN